MVNESGALHKVLHSHDVLARVALARLCHTVSRAKSLNGLYHLYCLFIRIYGMVQWRLSTKSVVLCKQKGRTLRLSLMLCCINSLLIRMTQSLLRPSPARWENLTMKTGTCVKYRIIALANNN